MKVINKKELTTILSEKLNNTISKKDIYHSITIICEYLLDQIKDNKSVSVDNFGTFSPFIMKGHKGYHIGTNSLHKTPSLLMVKFRPHIVLINMLKRKKDEFK